MKKSSAIILIIIVILVAMSVPLYFLTRPAPTPEGYIQIKGLVYNPATLNFTQLQQFQQATLQVTLTSSSNSADNGNFAYTGIVLSDLLKYAQVLDNATSVYIQTPDLGAVISIKDIMENDGMIIAYQKNGAYLTPFKDGGEGPYRLIISSDQYAQRWIKNVVVIEVV